MSDAGASPALPTEAEIEGAMVKAMLDGRGEVAEALAHTLRARREMAAGNVVDLRSRTGPTR